MQFMRSLAISLLSIKLLSATGTIVSGDDERYYKHQADEDLYLYYAKSNEQEAHLLDTITPQIVNHYTKSYAYRMDEPLDVVVTSSLHNQVANAFSTQFPFNMSVLFGGGSIEIDYFASNSWLKTLAVHEIAHNYQLNAKNSETGSTVHNIFGNNFQLTIPILNWPLFVYPNYYLPTYALEGNAVLNESTYGNGGRLFNGELLALTLTHFKDNMFDISKMINTTLDFPYGQIPYIIGGYFHAFLANRYSVDKVNQFYKKNSEAYIFPFLLAKTYREHFGLGYESLMYLFKREMGKKADKMQRLKAPTLATTQYLNKLTKQDGEILFLASPFAGRPTLHQYDIATHHDHTSTDTYPNARPFLVEDRMYFLRSEKNAVDEITIGLYDKELQLLPWSHSLAIQDIQNDHVLSIDATKSYNSAKLYKNDTFISITNSSAILDQNSSSYYFKNSGKTRTLYKEDLALFSYEGYWGFPVDVIGNSVYFIAPSEYGSSLYRYKDTKVTRVSAADNIVDAKMINNQSFIAATVCGNNYAFQKADIEIHDKEPYEITYSFENDNLLQAVDSHNVLDNEPLNEVTGLRYSATTPTIFQIDKQTFYDIRVSFVDKLLSNSLILGYSNQPDYKIGGLSYSNNREAYSYGISLNALLAFDEDKGEPSVDNIKGYLSVPLSKNPVRSTTATLQSKYSSVEGASVIGVYNYKYRRNYGQMLGYDDYFNMDLFAKIADSHTSLFNEPTRDNTIGASLYTSQSFWSESYFDLAAKVVASQNGHNVVIRSSLSQVEDISDFRMFAPSNYLEYKKLVGQIYTKLAKTTYASFYSTWFPFSLRRENFFVDYKYIQSIDNSDVTLLNTIPIHLGNDSYTEEKVGVDLELLILHKSVTNLRIMSINNSITGRSNYIQLESLF
jgi:hypothetical protein